MLLLCVFLWSLMSFSQTDEPILFSTAIETHIREYNKKSEQAFLQNDMPKVHALFDSLVQNIIVGTELDNFYVNKRSGKQIRLHRFKKPLFIITYSAWYPLAEGEIHALNQIAQEHSKEIDFIAIFWETKAKTKTASKGFSRKINVLFADEKENLSDNIIKSMKHSLGIPTAIFTDKNNIILDVGKLPAHHFNNDFDDSYNSKYNYFSRGVQIIFQ